MDANVNSPSLRYERMRPFVSFYRKAGMKVTKTAKTIETTEWGFSVLSRSGEVKKANTELECNLNKCMQYAVHHAPYGCLGMASTS